MTKLRALIAFWGLSLILGAAWLQTFRPRNRLVGSVLASEVTHVVAHLALYGTLATMLWFASSRRAVVIGITAAVALLQEGAQSVLYGRAPGRGEAFDLGVDAIALMVALLLCARLAPLSDARS